MIWLALMLFGIALGCAIAAAGGDRHVPPREVQFRRRNVVHCDPRLPVDHTLLQIRNRGGA